MKFIRSRLSARRTATFLLAALLFASAALSCADKGSFASGQTTDTNISAETSDTATERRYADVPVADYNGYVFNALYWFNSGWPWRKSKDIYAEEGNGDTVGDAVYKRNLVISEKYNVKFMLTEKSYDQLNSVLNKCVKSGDDVYTIVCQVQSQNMGMVTAGNLYDISQIPYINLENPWWDQNSVAGYSIANRVYIIASDITVNDKDGTAAIAFNKKAASDNQLPDLYAMARDGSWTIDNMYNTYKNAAHDLNGDSKMNEKDFYGFIGGRDVPATFFQGGGAMIISKDADDIPYLSFQSDRNFALAQRLFELVKQTDIFYDHHIMGTDDAAYQKLFEEDHGLYFWMRMDAVSDMRASETEFGILPIPKYTEDQTSYHCIVSIHTCSLMSVPVVSENFERTGILLEALAAESKYTLMHAYYDVALKTKYSRDDESSEMLDIIFSNRVFDLGELLNPGGLRDLILFMSDKKSYDIASAYAKLEKAAKKQLDKTVSQVEKLPA